jgi:hypothetical protein
MTVVVPSEHEVPFAIERLATLGYQHRGNLGIEGREAFTVLKGYRAQSLCEFAREPRLQNQLAARDYLRTIQKWRKRTAT